MKELDQLVENFLQPKPKGLGLDQLVEMIEEAMEEPTLEEVAAKDSMLDLYRDVAGDGEVKVTKLDQANKLADLSMTHYGSVLQPLYGLFGNSPVVNLTRDAEYRSFWDGYEESKRKADEKWEDALVAYANSKGVSAKSADDAIIDGINVEVKSTKGATPQFKLNSSGLKKDRKGGPSAYLLVTKSDSDAPQAMIVSGDLLWKIATFPLLSAAKAANKTLQDYIEEELSKAFEKVNLANMAARTVVSGRPSDAQKNFKIGNSPLTAQVRVMFTLGKIEEQKENP